MVFKYEGVRKTKIVRHPDVEQEQGEVGVPAGRDGLDSAMVKSLMEEGLKEVLGIVYALAGYSGANVKQ